VNKILIVMHFYEIFILVFKNYFDNIHA